jgi:hypothetical protein
MSLTLIVAAAAAATPHATHVVEIDHRGTPMQAAYSARAEIRHKTVGARVPNRMDMQRCQWTATIVIDRALNHSPALARTVSSRSHLTAVAEKDRAPLLAELEAVRNLASN